MRRNALITSEKLVQHEGCSDNGEGYKKKLWGEGREGRGAGVGEGDKGTN